MDEREAQTVLEQQIAAYRRRPYRDLVAMIGQQGTIEVTGESGTSYQLEAQAFWDHKRGGDVRIRVAIDDGGWRSMVPLCSDFIN